MSKYEDSIYLKFDLQMIQNGLLVLLSYLINLQWDDCYLMVWVSVISYKSSMRLLASVISYKSSMRWLL